jgi:hypothetical protein
MEQSGRIDVGRWIARAFEDSREKRRKAEEGRGTKRIQQIRKSLRSREAEEGRKVLEERGKGLKTFEEMRRRWMTEFHPILKSRNVT